MGRHITKTTWLLIILATAAIGFGLWGWMVEVDNPLGFNDALYRTLTAFFLSDVYQTPDQWNNLLSLNIARWCVLIAILLAASKAVTLLLFKQIETWSAQRRKGHIMIVGHSELASALAFEALKVGRKVTWLTASVAQKNYKIDGLFVLDETWNSGLADRFAMARAQAVVIAGENDASAIAIARQIRKKYPNEDAPTVHVSIASPWIAMRIDEVKGVKGIRLISIAQTAIRQNHRKHPPFLIAKKLGHRRIHSVIVGFGLYGEAVLLDTLLSSLTSYLINPRFTIIDPRARAIKNNLKIRYPELEQLADINFIERNVEGAAHSLNEEELIDINCECPITAFYVCLPDQTSSLSAAIALQTLIMRNGWNSGPVFVRLSATGTLPNSTAGVLHLDQAQLIGFGDMNKLIKDTGILNANADGLAKSMHAAYQTASSDDKVANVPWASLGEDKRDSNRRAVIHIAAKLSSAGLNIEPWLKEWDQKPDQAHLPRAKGILNNPELITKLAILEHDRWIADRRINGWRFGPERNENRRLHPDIIAFDKLSKKSQEYDRLVVKTLVEMLKED